MDTQDGAGDRQDYVHVVFSWLREVVGGDVAKTVTDEQVHLLFQLLEFTALEDLMVRCLTAEQRLSAEVNEVIDRQPLAHTGSGTARRRLRMSGKIEGVALVRSYIAETATMLREGS